MNKLSQLFEMVQGTENELMLARLCRALKVARSGIELNKRRTLIHTPMNDALTQLEKDIEDILGEEKTNGNIYRPKLTWDR